MVIDESGLRADLAKEWGFRDVQVLRPWIRPAVTAAVRALEALGSLPDMGLLHSDPAPEHFRLDASSGRCGLIDWITGPTDNAKGLEDARGGLS